jgi:hypothetical protein
MLRRLAFRDQNDVDVFGDHGIQIVESERKLIDPHHPLARSEIDGPQRVPDEQPGCVLFGRCDAVLQIEDHAVGGVKPRVGKELRLVARQVESRPPEALLLPRCGSFPVPWRKPGLSDIGAIRAPGGRLHPRHQDERESPEVLRDRCVTHAQQVKSPGPPLGSSHRTPTRPAPDRVSRRIRPDDADPTV